MVIIMLKNATVKITGVYKARRSKGLAYNTGREFHAISIRLLCKGTKLMYQNNTYLPKQGDVIYFPAGADYNIEIADYEELIVIHFDCYAGGGKNIEVFTPQISHIYQSLFSHIYTSWHEREIGSQLKCLSTFYSILYEIEKENLNNQTAISTTTSVKRAVDYLHNNFKDPNISVGLLSEIAGVSETYFRKIFSEYYDSAPLSYINNLRIEYAANQLQSQQYSIAEVAEISGFTSPKYFSTLFKKSKGISPLKFRNLSL